jgi:hypothetical protein
MSPPVFTVNTGLRTLDETRRLLYVVTSYLATNSDKLSVLDYAANEIFDDHVDRLALARELGVLHGWETVAEEE